MALEAELARLRAENARLLRLLKLTPQQAAPPGPAQAGYFEAPPGLVDDGSSPQEKVAFYAALFAARTDVYATRFENPRTGKSGWVPAVRGGWRKGSRHEDRDYLPLTPAVLAAHLRGEVHIGLYPLLDGDQCWWLAADFDGPEAMFDALMYVKAGRAIQVPVALEVSRSGVGAHAWTFFTSRSRPSWHRGSAPGCCARRWRPGSNRLKKSTQQGRARRGIGRAHHRMGLPAGTRRSHHLESRGQHHTDQGRD